MVNRVLTRLLDGVARRGLAICIRPAMRLKLMAGEGVFDPGLKGCLTVLPDVFIDRALPADMYAVAVLKAADIEAKVLGLVSTDDLGKRG